MPSARRSSRIVPFGLTTIGAGWPQPTASSAPVLGSISAAARVTEGLAAPGVEKLAVQGVDQVGQRHALAHREVHRGVQAGGDQRGVDALAGDVHDGDEDAAVAGRQGVDVVAADALARGEAEADLK